MENIRKHPVQIVHKEKRGEKGKNCVEEIVNGSMKIAFPKVCAYYCIIAYWRSVGFLKVVNANSDQIVKPNHFWSKGPASTLLLFEGITVAMNELSCLKNEGAWISLFFTSYE